MVKQSTPRLGATATARLGAAALIILTAACNSDAEPRGEWRTVRTQSGDTLIVRTENAGDSSGLRTLIKELDIGSADSAAEYLFDYISAVAATDDGRIWVLDQSLRSVRAYQEDGKYILSAGRSGDGPGEFQRPAGMILRGQDAMVWDAAAGALLLYDSSGAWTGTWSAPLPRYTGTVIYDMLSDSAGSVFLRGRVTGTDDKSRYAIARIGALGTTVDTLLPPSLGVPSNVAVASARGGATAVTVRLAPTEHWDFSPLGYFVIGRTDVYALHLVKPDGSVTRIERSGEPLPLAPGEWEKSMENVYWSMRQYEPQWSWTGLVPKSKPHFHGIAVDSEGRIWVHVSVAEEPVPTRDGDTMPPGMREPRRYDVFAPTGELLGRIAFPDGITPMYQRGNHVWGRELDNDGVHHVVRYRIEPPLSR